MDLLVKAPVRPCKLAVLSGSFHPITNAHVGLAEAALAHVQEVLFVMPREFPHKRYEDVGLVQRIELVKRAVSGHASFSVGIAQGGLFIDIARECRDVYGREPELLFLCGRDAAERIVHWDYGPEASIDEQLEEFGLLVAEREGRFHAPGRLRHRIQPLDLEEQWQEISATEIRRRISAGEEWKHLVPDPVQADVERLYRR